MKFNELTFSTKFKLVAGNILLIIGAIILIVSGLEGIIPVVVGNLLNLDGRISRLEEIQDKNNTLPTK